MTITLLLTSLVYILGIVMMVTVTYNIWKEDGMPSNLPDWAIGLAIVLVAVLWPVFVVYFVVKKLFN